MKVKEISKAKNIKIKKWPKVAIIILNWNGWKGTLECLESVFRNSYPNYQVIVIDNGSIDGSIEKIKAWAEGKQEALTPEPKNTLYYLSHPPVIKSIPYIYYTRAEAKKGGNIKLEQKVTREWQERGKTNDNELNPTTPYPLIFIQTGENLGFAGGNNIGIGYMLKKEYVDYVWLLNNDTVIDKNALIEMIKLGENNEQIGMVGSKLLYYKKPNTIQALGGSSKIAWNTFGKHICDLKEDQFEFNNDFEIKGYICGASLLVKKKVIEAVGIIDESYFMLAEDLDWCFRTSKKSWKLFYSGGSKVWHKFGASMKKNNIDKSFLGRRSTRLPINRFIMNNYYFTRGCLHFQKKFNSNSFIVFCIYLLFKILKQSIGIVLYDDCKFYRIKILFKGFHDGIKGKMGRTMEFKNINKY